MEFADVVMKRRAVRRFEEGGVDRAVLERITAPVEHVLRNAVIHGIEAPAVRVARGKPAAGTIARNRSATLSRSSRPLRMGRSCSSCDSTWNSAKRSR